MTKTRQKIVWHILLAVVLCILLTIFIAPATADHAETETHGVLGDWTAWGAEEGQQTTLPTTAGNYYLVHDIILSQEWQIPAGTTINLCLNGSVIQQTGNSRVINVPDGATLNVYDCGDTLHSFTKTTISTGYTIWNLQEGGEITLAGGVITGGGNTISKGGGIYVCGNLTLSGGNIVGNNATAASSFESGGGGVYIENTGNFTLIQGNISGNAGYRGGGIYVRTENNNLAYADFSMSGGNITGNSAVDGGGILIIYGSTASTPVYISGGTIQDNVATVEGGGIAILAVGRTVQISDCTISENRADEGGGIQLRSSNAVTLNNVRITDNRATDFGGGIGCEGLQRFAVSGLISIQNNYLGMTGTSQNNVYLEKDDWIDILGLLDTTSQIKVTTKDKAGLGYDITVATSDTEYIDQNKNCIFEDRTNSDLQLKVSENKIQLGYPEQEHPILPIDHHHDGIDGDWYQWIHWGNTFPKKNYVLMNDVEVGFTITITDDKTICLNGSTLSLASGREVSVIKVTSGATLTICDCPRGITHTISSGTGETITLTGGIITGGNATQYGGGIYVESGTLKIYGGNIAGNNVRGIDARFGGGGIYVAPSGTLYLFDGNISGNTAYRGGGIFVESPGSGHGIIMTGGTIQANKVTGAGGGLLIRHPDRDQTVSNGTITNNECTGTEGGGIAILGAGSGKVFLSDMEISGNRVGGNSVVGDGGGIKMRESNTVLFKNVTITGNSATGSGGGIISMVSPSLYGRPGSHLTFSGLMNISQNTANVGSNFYRVMDNASLSIDSSGLLPESKILITPNTYPADGNVAILVANAKAVDMGYISLDDAVTGYQLSYLPPNIVIGKNPYSITENFIIEIPADINFAEGNTDHSYFNISGTLNIADNTELVVDVTSKNIWNMMQDNGEYRLPYALNYQQDSNGEYGIVTGGSTTDQTVTILRAKDTNNKNTTMTFSYQDSGVKYSGDYSDSLTFDIWVDVLPPTT